MKRTNQGFTRLELLFVGLAFGLVLLPAISLLASSQSGSQRVVCFNNLRQIGRALQVWANDHNDVFHWQLPTTEGGTYQSPQPLAKTIWYQYFVLSNQLGSPRILVCPADSGTTKVADTWGFEPGGLPFVPYQNAAVSYILSLHAQPYGGNSLLSGDRNIQCTHGVTCSYLNSPVLNQLTPGDPSVAWTNSIHGTAGHLLFADGSVQFADSSELRIVADRNANDNSFGIHYLGK